jgi:hypothetical protein
MFISIDENLLARLREKDEEISELNHRIVELEAEREREIGPINSLKEALKDLVLKP